jgi:hypothetical protein
VKGKLVAVCVVKAASCTLAPSIERKEDHTWLLFMHECVRKFVNFQFPTRMFGWGFDNFGGNQGGPGGGGGFFGLGGPV